VNQDQIAVIGFPFDFDATRGGQLFRDPDGDALSYEVQLVGTAAGLSVSGGRITGTPSAPCSCNVTVTARDGRGGTASQSFALELKPNSAPSVSRPNPNVVTTVNTGLDYDATQGGQTFSDSDRHVLTYQLTIISAPPGFGIQGTRIVGMFSAPGFVKAKITAEDGFGGSAEDSFGLVVPFPVSTSPTLPAESFVYEDAKLPLPSVFTMQGGRPSNDTTPDDNPITDAGATLGRVLFYDKRLSITNTHSCGSCHEQAHGFASSQQFASGSFGILTKRSPMHLTNVRYNHQNRYFSDARAPRLEELVSMPIEDRDELGATMPQVEQELSATDFYPPLFQAAFGSAAVTRDRITKAVAQFLRSLIAYQTKYDRAHYSVDPATLPDPSTILTAQEQRGFEVFLNGQCFHCHDTSTFASPWPANNGIDEVTVDPGAGDGAFRVSSLRNIASTGPYMHDGRFTTLRQVIDHYDSGIKPNPNLSPLLGLPSAPRRLNLSEEDKAALEAFFNTLTDTTFLADPKFSDPFE
jgi:cytochrome c peroxidase